MFKNKKILLPALILLIGGCTEVEVRPGQYGDLRNSPVNEGQRPGIISYDAGIREDRQEAYDEMAKSCNGAYKILKEEVRREDGSPIYDGKGRVIGNFDEKRVYVTFKCENRYRNNYRY